MNQQFFETQLYPWKELIRKKEEFYRILKVLNNYYSRLSNESGKSDSQKFRENLIEKWQEITRVYIKRFSEMEYLITVVVSGKIKESDSWIHIDGIQQERNELKEKGMTSHPVFEIVCMSDLYETACIVLEKVPDIYC